MCLTLYTCPVPMESSTWKVSSTQWEKIRNLVHWLIFHDFFDSFTNFFFESQNVNFAVISQIFFRLQIRDLMMNQNKYFFYSDVLFSFVNCSYDSSEL